MVIGPYGEQGTGRRVIGPYGEKGTGRRVIGPYGEKGRFLQPPGPAAHSEASAPAVARNGWELEQRSSPKCPATPDNPSVTAKP